MPSRAASPKDISHPASLRHSPLLVILPGGGGSYNRAHLLIILCDNKIKELYILLFLIKNTSIERLSAARRQGEKCG